jgi:hypothetical protein
MTHSRKPRRAELGPRPFDGPNPFADNAGPPIPFPPSSDPLAGPAVAEVQPFQPVDIELTQSDRSYRVLLFGVLGSAFVAMSLLIATVVMATTGRLAEELVYCWPTDLLGLSLCIPAWVMARSDLQAIRAGAMDQAGWRRTRIAYWCGFLGSILATLPFLAVIVAIVMSFLS